MGDVRNGGRSCRMCINGGRSCRMCIANAISVRTSRNLNRHINISRYVPQPYTATGAALATCLTGYSEYGDRFNLDDGLFSEDNLHIMLGVLGTLAHLCRFN